MNFRLLNSHVHHTKCNWVPEVYKKKLALVYAQWSSPLMKSHMFSNDQISPCNRSLIIFNILLDFRLWLFFTKTFRFCPWEFALKPSGNSTYCVRSLYLFCVTLVWRTDYKIGINSIFLQRQNANYMRFNKFSHAQTTHK